MIKFWKIIYKKDVRPSDPFSKIQNEILKISGVLIGEKVVDDIEAASAYHIFADESADISGKE